MGLLDSILCAVTKKTEASGGDNPLVGAVGGILQQCGGLQGLMNRFSQEGLGKTFSSWVSTGQNHQISGEEVQQVLGSEQVKALAAKLGIDSEQASQFLAQYLPQVVDQLTPAGKIDPSADHQQKLSSLIPSLLEQICGKQSS